MVPVVVDLAIYLVVDTSLDPSSGPDMDRADFDDILARVRRMIQVLAALEPDATAAHCSADENTVGHSLLGPSDDAAEVQRHQLYVLDSVQYSLRYVYLEPL